MLTSDQISECVLWACQQEVSAPKPGNVSPLSDAHGMTVNDFLVSAVAIAPILANSSLSVGEMILQSIKATRERVNSNTNLGIVLLFAPLCLAVSQSSSMKEVKFQLQTLLAQLTVEDAVNCYKAIRLAEAGGMGTQANHDLNQTPTITLFDAMAYAQNYDNIAKQYVSNFDTIFQIGLTHLKSRINCGETVEWASAFAYLNFLSTSPDTLVSRKYGMNCAQTVSKQANFFLEKVNKNSSLRDLKAEIVAWDEELKMKAINPGTTADMTAAALLVYAFEQMLSKTEFHCHEIS
jgi:triphosphoribosyl-dephospho-CoA synthase